MMRMMENHRQDPAASGDGAADPTDIGALQRHLGNRGTHEPGEHPAWEWHAEYLRIAERIMRQAGLGEAGCAPMREIADRLLEIAATGDDPATQHASEYARASAEIAYLILTGTEESEAAQRVARRLLVRQIPLPAHGGDARGWKRLLEYREHIRQGQVCEDIARIYREHLAHIKESRSAGAD